MTALTEAYNGLCAFGWDILGVYENTMRSSLFTGFLTLSSFLMAVTSFIVINVKKEVLDKDHYKKQWRMKYHDSDISELYKPLKKMSHYFIVSILLALAASLSQFTIGIIHHPLAMLFCLLISLAAFVSLFLSIRLLVSEIKVLTMWMAIEDKK